MEDGCRFTCRWQNVRFQFFADVLLGRMLQKLF
jgi:hypothetical protein